MAALTTDNIGEVIIPVIIPVIRQVIREEVPPIVRDIVREETEPRFEAIGQDLQNITMELQRHGKILDEHSQMLQEHSQELYRLGVLYEDLDDRFRADSELLRENLNVQSQVRYHESRLQEVESTQVILKRVVTEHSQQLNAT